jgi:hypothetical protein
MKQITSPKDDNFLLIAHGSMDEISKAKDVLKNPGHEMQVHAA